MAKTKSNATKNLPFKKLYAYSLSGSVLCLILVFIFKQQLPPEVPVFYGRPEGEEVLGGSLSLMIPALTSLIITTVNLSLTSFVESPFLKKTLAASALVATLFSVITTLKIFILVT